MAPFPGEGQPEMREAPSSGEGQPAMRDAPSPGVGQPVMLPAPGPGSGPGPALAPSPADGQPDMRQAQSPPPDGQHEIRDSRENSPPPGNDTSDPNAANVSPAQPPVDPRVSDNTGGGVEDAGRSVIADNSGFGTTDRSAVPPDGSGMAAQAAPLPPDGSSGLADPRYAGQLRNVQQDQHDGPGPGPGPGPDPGPGPGPDGNGGQVRNQNGGGYVYGANYPVQPIFDGGFQAPFTTYSSTPSPGIGAAPTPPASNPTTTTTPSPTTPAAPNVTPVPNPTGGAPPMFTVFPSTLSDGRGQPPPTGAPDPAKAKPGDSGPHGLNPTAEHLLISAGSIVAFILVCLGCWIMWRKAGRSKRSSHAGSRSPRPRLPHFPERWRNKMSFSRRERGWTDLDISPPDYQEKRSSGQEAVISPLPLRRVSGGPLHTHVAMMGQANNMAYVNGGMGASGSTGSTGNSGGTGTTATTATSGTSGSSGTIGSVLTVNNSGMYSQRAEPSIASTHSQMDPNDTIRSVEDAYDGTRRHMNRVSELSSLSSGFGDGDIIITAACLPPRAPSATTPNMGGRFSWMPRVGNRASTTHNDGVGGNNPRDTVYTQDSEDLPARFRTVTSWVDQQAGRIKRAQQRGPGDGPPPVPQVHGWVGVPGIPNAPSDQHFSLMMNDGEEPRRVEDALAAGIVVGSGGSTGHAHLDDTLSPISDTASRGAPGLSVSP